MKKVLNIGMPSNLDNSLARKIILFLASVLFFCLFSVNCNAVEDLLSEANTFYEKGLKASTLGEKSNAFNQSLSLYLELEQSLPLSSRSSTLNAVIADNYAQLGEYARAILYDYRAIKLDPSNSLLLQHLMEAEQKLGLPSTYHEDTFNRFLSFNNTLTVPHRLQVFFILSCLLIAAASWLIWRPSLLTKIATFTVGLFTFIIFSNLILSFYFTPLEGILIAPSGLYRQPDITQSQLTFTPLLKGTKLTILDWAEEGQWLKVADKDGKVGFVPSQILEII